MVERFEVSQFELARRLVSEATGWIVLTALLVVVAEPVTAIVLNVGI